MEAFMLTLAAGLGPALITVINKLAEKAVVEPALEKGFEPFKEWFTGGYDQAKVDAELQQTLLLALDDLRAELSDDPYESLFATIKFTGLDAATWQTLAAAAVEMVRVTPSTLPPNLLQSLDLNTEKSALLARFLFFLRKHLANLDGFRAGISYANDLETHGLLAGITEDISSMIVNTERTASGVETLVAYFGIAIDENEVLREYLETLRAQLQFLPLPLADPGTASQTDAELRQVFVPLLLRDQRAEEEARRKAEQHNRRSRHPEEMLQAEDIQPIQLGELLARHERFALIGGAGSGKTTLLKIAALSFAENRAKEDLGWNGEPLFPIFLRLRNLGAFLSDNPRFNEPGPGALTAYLTHHFSASYDLDLTPSFFKQRLRKGHCLVLLDGLDEVSQERANVAQQVNAFIRHYGPKGNRFGLASRPRGYETVDEYLRPASLAVCDVTPLDSAGICRLAGNLLRWIVNDPRQLAEDQKNLADKILSSTALTELASTPLFCTALTLVYKYHGSDLPQRRVDVLEQVVDLLLGFWKAQEPGLAKKPELAVLDGTGENEIDLEMAVANKRSRLSYLAYQMQLSDTKTEVNAGIAKKWLQKYLEDEEGQSPETAGKWAEGFLRYAHEHSGLFVEQDGPGVFVFTHEGFREYLAARELIDLGDAAFIENVLAHIIDDAWEQIILLAAAFRGYSKRARQDLITGALEKTQQLRSSGLETWLRCLTMTGRMANDMGRYLPAPQYKAVESALHAAMIDAQLTPAVRAAAADILDELGYLPADLYEFVPIPDSQSPNYLIARYPVTNAQYRRFVEAEDFAAREYWIDFPKFAEPEKNYVQMGDWGDEGWQWLQKNWDEDKKKYPRYWDDVRFGIARLGVPLVGITWYEANAYCKWLLAHWDDLAEGEQNSDLKPEILRLPTEAEWIIAAGGLPSPVGRGAGGEGPDRFPWDKAGEITQEKAEILRRANVVESNIGRTTPVGMYPLGVSPTGVWDMGGNVWEWQANYRDKDHDVLTIRGGSWNGNSDLVRLSCRHGSRPNFNWDYSGFRVVALPSGRF